MPACSDFVAGLFLGLELTCGHHARLEDALV
jgi:hypothetical protein